MSIKDDTLDSMFQAIHDEIHANDKTETDDMLDNDPVLKELRVKIDTQKEQISLLLQETVNRMVEIIPSDVPKTLVVGALVEGLKEDLCVRTMDLVEPNWMVDGINRLVGLMGDIGTTTKH